MVIDMDMVNSILKRETYSKVNGMMVTNKVMENNGMKKAIFKEGNG